MGREGRDGRDGRERKEENGNEAKGRQRKEEWINGKEKRERKREQEEKANRKRRREKEAERRSSPSWTEIQNKSYMREYDIFSKFLLSIQRVTPKLERRLLKFCMHIGLEVCAEFAAAVCARACRVTTTLNYT